jgi:hypothetical protein
MKAKIVFYIEREDGKRISATNEAWFSYETRAFEVLKLIFQAIQSSFK